MIWESVWAMTVVDLAVISAVAYTIAYFIKIHVHLPQPIARRGLLIIGLGLSVTSIFYLVDLASMHLLPLFMAKSSAMNFMRDLHLNFNWFVALISVGSITLGLILNGQALLRLVKNLHYSEERFRDFAESASDWFWEMGPDLRFTYFSDRYQDMTGYDQARRIGSKREDSVPRFELDGNPEKWAAHNADLEARRPFKNFEYASNATQDGLRHVRVSGKPVFGPDGTFLGYRGTGIDITGEKIADSALREMNERFRAIVDNSLSGIVINDEEGKYHFVNNTYAEWSNVAAKDIVGKSVFDVFPKQQAEEISRTDIRVIADHDINVDVGEVRRTFGDGITRDLMNHKIPIDLDSGKTRAVITILTDLTKFKETENKLHQAQKMEAVGQLTGGVAHDFNNILTTVIGNLDLASNHTEENSEIWSLIEQARGAAWRGAKLTERLLAFSRRQALMPQVINARDLLERMTDLLRRTLEESVGIEFVGEDNLWLCKADSVQLESAILNLAINARDAMPDGGKLTIETENVSLDDDYAARQEDVTPGQYVMVAVTDTGTGMPQDVIDRVFDPFFTTKEVGKGSGLGLSMVYGFVKQSGGHVTVYSEEGVGTTVKLYLPRSQGEKATVATVLSTRPSEVPRASGETILVVEDDPDVRSLNVAVLSDLGYEVSEAADGPSALSMLEKLPHVDLLFTDVVLPGGMKGTELAAEVTRRRPEIAVLYTSGYMENALVHQGHMDEDFNLLSKPFRHDDLARKVRAVIHKSHA